MAPPRWSELEQHLHALHAAALDAAAPGPAMRRYLQFGADALTAGPHALPLTTTGRVHIIAFGKASVGMAAAAHDIIGSRTASTIVAHPHGVEPMHGPNVQSFAAGHPIPDAASLAAGDAVVQLLSSTAPDDVVLVLVSGGGSALLEALHEGIDLDQLRELTQQLQHAGADIFELNTVRRALSRIKGGGLARLAAPARVIALLLSDVMGDDPQTIASGPTVPSPTGAADAIAVIKRYVAPEAAASILSVLESRTRTATNEAPASQHVIVGSNRLAVDAVVAAAQALGFHAQPIEQALRGEARTSGAEFARAALHVRDANATLQPPRCIVAGGETTVTVTGKGRGGRSQEFALGAAGVISGLERSAVFAFGTDGIDGASRAAGAVVTGATLTRALELGLSAERALANNDSEPFFDALGDLWVTGPSGTNVNDIAIALLY